MIHAVRIALLTIRLVMRTKIALFFTFLFPQVFLFIYAGLFAHGNPEAVVYMFGPVVTLNIMGSGFWGLGMQSVVQRERGSLRRYRLAPIGSGTMVLSNLLANYLLGLPTIGLLVFCAVAVFHMPLKIGLLTLLILVTVGTFAFAGFGLTIASVANTMQEAQIYNNVVWLSLLFLSGVTVPLPLLPHWVQRLAAFLPATYLVTSFQAIMVQGRPLVEHWAEMVVLVVSGVFGLLFAWKLFRWEKEEKISSRAKWLSLTFIIPFLITGMWMNTRQDLTSSWAIAYRLMERGNRGAEERPATNRAMLIEDFEGREAAENVLQRWQVSTDAAHGGHSMAEVSLITPGAAGSQHALRFKGHLVPASGSGMGMASAQFEVKVPPGVKDLHGIEFEARGDGRVYLLRLYPTEASLSPIQPAISIVPLSDWQSVRLLDGWLAHPPFGIPPSSPWVFEITVEGERGEFSLDVDEIKFY